MPLENSGNKISSIRYCKEKVVVRLVNKEKLDLPHDVFTSFYLFKGKTLTDLELLEIKRQIETYDLYKYALKISQKKMYSELKMREKLYAKEASKAHVDEVINKLKNSQLINDDSFVNEYVEYANNKNIGKNKIIAKLKEKGVFQPAIDKIRFLDKLELEKAKTYIDKLDKRYDKYSYKAKKDKSIQYLVNQGFDLDIALQAVNNLSNPKPKDELYKLKTDYQVALRKYQNKYRRQELKEHIISYLLRKGYKMSDILKMMED